MKLFVNKRGISPLVATILLIAFSVLLGAVVMSWGESYIEEKAEFVTGAEELISGCDAVKLSIIEINNEPQVCYRGHQVELWLENGPSVGIWNLHAKIVGTNNVIVKESILEKELAKNGAAKIFFSSVGAGTPRKITLTPKVKIGKKVAFCDEKALVIEEIRGC